MCVCGCVRLTFWIVESAVSIGKGDGDGCWT